MFHIKCYRRRRSQYFNRHQFNFHDHWLKSSRIIQFLCNNQHSLLSSHFVQIKKKLYKINIKCLTCVCLFVCVCVTTNVKFHRKKSFKIANYICFMCVCVSVCLFLIVFEFERVESALILEKRYFRCMVFSSCRLVLFSLNTFAMRCVISHVTCDIIIQIFIMRLPMVVLMLMMVECMHCPLVMQHLPVNWPVLRPMVIESHAMMMMTMTTILWNEYVDYYLLSLYWCHCCCCPHRHHFQRLVMGYHDVDHHCYRNNRRNL